MTLYFFVAIKKCPTHSTMLRAGKTLCASELACPAYAGLASNMKRNLRYGAFKLLKAPPPFPEYFKPVRQPVLLGDRKIETVLKIEKFSSEAGFEQGDTGKRMTCDL